MSCASIPTFLPIQDGRCGAGAWIRGGVVQAQGIKPLGRGRGQVPGQHPEDAEHREEVLGAAGPHAAASGPGCPGWGSWAHPARLCCLLPAHAVITAAPPRPDTPLARPGTRTYGPHPAGAQHQHGRVTVQERGGAAGNHGEGSQGREELMEPRRGRAGEEMLPGNGE